MAFLGKLFFKYLCQIGARMRFFKFFKKSMPRTFVLHEVTVAFRLKIDRNHFFWKNLAFRIWVQMGPEMDSK